MIQMMRSLLWLFLVVQIILMAESFSLQTFRPQLQPQQLQHQHQLQRFTNRLVMVQRGGGSKSGGAGGGTALDSRVKQEVKSTLKDEIERDYRLILHDDTVHTIQQVCEILGKNCPLCPGARAYEVTLETHMSGAATVAVANKKIVEEYCKKLQQAGLTVSMAPDDEFEGGEGEDEE